MLHRFPTILRCGALLAVVCLLAGCQSARFYTQAVKGQWRVLTHREPIPKLIANTNTPPKLKQQLELVLGFREYAEKELGLSAKGHYISYVDLGRPHVVWNVHATPEFSLQDKTWDYPIVGALNYQGYFREADARQYAAKLAEQGMDAFVQGVDAYSTLGWFSDPVMSSFVNYPESDLAAVIFHELAHQRVFISGDTEFNEAFATCVERESVRRWLKAHRGDMAVAAYNKTEKQEDEFVQLVLAARHKRDAFFASSTAMPPDERRAAKAALVAELRADYERLKSSWGGRGPYDHWFSESLNNAQLNTVATYNHLVPGFDRLLAECGGSLPEFYRRVEAMGHLSKAQRHRSLEQLLADSGR